MITIYSARKIYTMNPSHPVATHVAVCDGRILGAGSREELVGWGDHKIDERFADLVLMPGLVEGHSHTMEGSFWRYVYCGYFDRRDPDGKVWSGVKSIDDVISRLREAQEQLEIETLRLLDGRLMQFTLATAGSVDKTLTEFRKTDQSVF